MDSLIYSERSSEEHCSASVGETPVDLRCDYRAVPLAKAKQRIVSEGRVRRDGIVIRDPPKELLEHRSGGAQIRAAHLVPLQGVENASAIPFDCGL
jgi:hypothetical protein